MTAEPSRFDRLLRHAFAADAGEPAGAGVADGPDRPELPVRYVVLGEIAHGGMGLVLRARDTVLGREVAVKVLRARHRGRGNLTARFVAEAQITGQLQHPGVPALHEVGICPDQRPWFSMRLVSGRTLAGRLAERADPSIGVAGLLAVALAIARTVAYAHARGVVHRDLKPSNIMVGAFGEVQVMDWGMAKVLGEGGNADELRAREAWQPIATTRSSDAGSATLAGSIFGTPAYMPPEQARGEIDRIDRRGDVFAIGAILCEMLIGRPPYSGTDDEIVGQARAGAVEPALEEVGRRGVAADLVSLVRDCLRPDRDERPVDCGAVAERLAAHLDAVEADRRRAEARAFAERRTRRLTALVAAVVVAALATAFASWRAVDIERSRREQEGRRLVERAIDDTRLQLARAEASTGSATELLVAATAASARAVELARERGQLQAAAAEIRARSVALEAAARREQHLLAAIETAQRVHLSTFDWSALNAAYDRAFASFASQPEELAAAVRQSLRPAALIAALDDWGLVQLNARVDSERLDRVLDEVDPDADRRRLRTATGDVALAESILARGLHCLSPRTCVVAAGQYLQCGRMEDWLRVLVAAHAVHPDDYWVAFLLAEEYGRRGDAEGRARAAAAAAAIRPHSFGAVNLAAALCDAGRWHEADALTRELLRQRPDGALERAHRIRVLADLGHEAEAVALLADLPDGPERLHALMRLGRPEEAEIVCRRLLAQRPRDPDLLLDLGRLHAAGGRAADALTCYRRAFEADPTHADAAIALADASRDAGDPETALSAALAASELLPDSAQVAAVLGYVDRERGELDAALQHYRRAWLAEPDLPGLWREFSACLLRRGDSAAADEALQVLTAAVADRPEDPEVRYTKAFLHWQRGEHELVLVETTSLLRGHPEHFETLRLRFYSAQELGCRDLAADAIDAIARQRTDDIDLACAQADALRAAGRLRSALAAADRACALDGTRVEPRVSRGRVLVAMGRFSTALEVLRPLAQLEPARADVQALLGRSLLAVGRPSEAVSAFERALPLDGEPELPVGSWLNEARTRAAAGGNVGGRPSGQR